MNKPKVRPTAKPAMSEEQRKALEEEMRNNQAFGKRASVAANLLPSVIRSYPELSEEEQVAKATRLAELVMKDLLGITFTEKPQEEAE